MERPVATGEGDSTGCRCLLVVRRSLLWLVAVSLVARPSRSGLSLSLSRPSLDAVPARRLLLKKWSVLHVSPSC